MNILGLPIRGTSRDRDNNANLLLGKWGVGGVVMVFILCWWYFVLVVGVLLFLRVEYTRLTNKGHQ